MALVWLAAVFCIGSGVAQAALSEGFNATGWGGSYGTYTVNGWTLTSVYRETTSKYEGAAAVRFSSTGTRNIVSPQNSGGIGTVSFWHREWSASDGKVDFEVYISTNGTAWSSAVGSGSSTSDTYSQYSVAVNNAAAKYVKIGIKSGKRWLVDLVEVSDAPVVPTVTTLPESSVAATSAVLGGNVTAAGGATVTNRGVVYKTSSGVTIGDNKTQIGTGTGAFSNTVSSLSVNTRYYFRAYAQNSAGTSLGSESNFWTLANVPSAPTVAAVSSSSVSVDVNVNGNPSTTTFAIYETTQSKYVQSDGTLGASAYWATDATWGTKSVTGLGVNQQYTFKVKARNGAGTPVETDFSGTASKYTLAAVPSAPTVNNPTSSSLDITVNVNGNPSSTEFAIQRTSDNQYLQTDGTWGASAAWATAATWGTKTATGLSPSTTYYFQVKARNGANAETTFSSTGNGTTSASGCATQWTVLDNRGQPVYSDYYLGDYLAYIYYFQINVDTWGWTTDYGLGTTSDGSGWTWRSATYDSNNGTDWKWKSKASEHQFTSAGDWYYAGRFVNGGCTYYADKTWQSTTAKALDATNYFTVNALNNPGSQTATAAGATNISLSWAKDAQSHDVMIVRSTDSSFTAPTQGTAYTAGSSTIGGDLVIYNGNGTSYNDTGRTQGTIYYYKFYSVNNDYYSAGVTANATTWTLPTVSTTSATPGTPADPTQANATGNVTADGGATVTERGIVWQSNSGDPDTSDNKVPHASGGTGSFTVTLTGLTPGQTVYYRAYASNSVGVSYGTTLNFAADCFTNGPGVLDGSNVGSDSFTANWEAVAGASGYEIDVMTSVGGGSGGNSIEENIQNWTARGSYGNYTQSIPTGTVTMTACLVQPSASASGDGSIGRVQMQATTGIIELPSLNTVGTVTMTIAAGGAGRSAVLQRYNGSTWDTLTTWSGIGTTGATFSYQLNSSDSGIILRLASPSAAIYVHDIIVSANSSPPTYVSGYQDLSVGNVTSWLVEDLDPSTEYFYRVRATNAFCTSADSKVTNVTTIAGTPSVTLADNGTQVAAGNVAAGTANHVLHKFSLAVSSADATLTAVGFTSAGTYAASDLDNFKIWFSANNTLDTGADVLLGTITTGLGAGAHSLSSISQVFTNGATGYVFITANVKSTAAAGKTISLDAVATGDLTFTSANKSGSTTAGGAQTITSAVTISLHANSPAAGYINAGANNAVLFGFTLTPASGSFDFTGLVVDIAGTATSSDLSNFEIVYDADGDGEVDGGESVVSDTKAIGATITFVMSGQTGISAVRNYLLIADVAAAPTAGRTITASLDTAGVTTTGTESGDADGAQQTIRTAPILTSPTATAIGQTAATLGATLSANGGATVSDYGVVWNTAGSPTTADNKVQESTTEPSMPDVYDVSATGLGQGTKVYYRGYAINSVGTAYSAQGSFHTEPGQASNVQFANVTATGMRITWSAGADSDGAIVVVRASSAVVDDPTDGVAHNANAAFGSGANLGNSSYVVHRGAGTQVDVTGLTAGTTYHVAVYAFKGTVADSGNDLGINYRQTSPATGNKPTLAAEPTSNSTSLSFSNVGAYAMDLSWTSGNGASRIVVVRQGSATSWTPTDGTAPSGVNANFASATDQGSGNKICYNGSGNSFTLSGLDPETTYYVTVIEYNGSGTEVNYYLGGTLLAGNQATTAAACVPDQVALIQQAGYYTSWNADGGVFNNGGTELGMWAHGGTPQVAAWRTFKTSGNGGGDNRELQPGDRFRISVHGYSPYGILGASLNDGAATGSWANRHSNTRGYIQCGNSYGDLYVTYGSGSTASWSGIRPWNTTITMEFHVLSSREFTANIVGQTPKYDLSMMNSPGDNDRIDGYSIYYENDWNGSANVDAYWKQETTVTNLGYVEFGADGGTRTIYGKITDGTNPHCPDFASPNYLKKSGAGTITLANNDSTYTLYTDIAGGTLSIASDGALGTPPAAESPLHLRISGAGAALVGSDTFTLNANRGLILSNWMYWGVADTKVMTYNGAISDGAGSYQIVKNQGGELVLGGNNAYDNGTYIDNGTLTLNHANAAGTGGIYVGQDSGSFAATLNLGAALTLANNVTIRTESSGVKTLKATETATLGGNLAIAETDDDRFSIDVASGKTLTVGGTVSGESGGGKITKTGAGTAVFSGVNTHDKKVQINAGKVSITASRNLGADPGGAYTNKILLNGGTLSADATFTLNSNNGIALHPGNGFIEVTDGYTLTYGGAITGTGGMGKTGTGTLLLTGANTFAGALTNSAGTIQIGNNGTSGSVSANIVNDAALVWHRSDNATYAGQISGTGTLTKNGAGTLTLSGTSSMSGDTTVSAGTLLVSGSLANSEVTVSSGATLMGAGTVGDLVIGGTVDPGDSAAASATLSAGAVTLVDGGAMRVDMDDVDGVAGTDWDLIDASGTITVNGTGTFTIYLYGSSTGFDSTQSYEWTIVDGTVSGFDAGSFAVDASNFAHDLGGGSFSIAEGSLKLVFTPRTPDAPAALTATATGPDSIQLAFTRNSSNDPVVIVYDLDGTFGTPTGTVPAVGQAFAGGTVVYAGGTSPQNHTGLTACQTYYYKAWSYNGTNFSATGLTDNKTTSAPAAPASVWAGTTNVTSFTAAWAASAGAASYRLDVSTNAGFAIAGATISTNFAQFDFPAALSLAPTFVGSVVTSSVMSLSSGAIETNITTGTYFPNEPYVEETGGWGQTSQSAAKYFTFTIYPIDGNSITITGFTFRAYATAAGPSAFSSDIDGGACTYTVNAPDSSILLVQHTVTNVVNRTGAIEVKIQGWHNSSRTTAGTGVFRLDDVQITGTVSGGGGAPSFVAGYSNLQVTAATSASVTGLTADTTYYFRVRAEGAGSCASDNSPTGSVTTKSSALDPPAAFSATAASASQIDLSFTKNGDDDAVVIVFDLDGTFEAPSGTPPAVGNSFAGGTLIYNGTGTGHSHTGLDACETYYYRAWSYDSTGPRWSTPLNDDEQTEGPDAPAGVWASVTNYTDFTAGWSAATGAESYRIDVSTSSNFTGAGGTPVSTNLIAFDFAGYAGSEVQGTSTTAAANMQSPSYITRGAGLTAVGNADRFNAQGWGDHASSSAAMTAGDYFEWTIQPQAGYTIAITNVVLLIQRSASGASNLALRASIDSYAADLAVRTGMSGTATITIESNLTYVTGLQSITGAVTFRVIGWWGQSTGSMGFEGTGNDILLQGTIATSGSGGSYVAGYENRLVAAGTSTSVTGLTEDTTYYFRVRTEAGSCTSDNSPTGSVTTGISSVAAPAAFSATAAGPTQIDLTFTPNALSHNVVIVYNATGSFDAPAGAPPAAGNAFAGGTVLYNGTSSPVNHTGLSACQTVYYRAWSYLAAGNMWSSPLSDDATTTAPAAPTLVYASDTNYTDFVAEWLASPGATGYYLDVSESATFTASGGSSTRMLLASNAATSPGAITNEWSGYNLSGS
ncbi:MAG TPA: autotransporter-associated beta strand repeat-containing protein, partial [Kiritimatiellia bacterium]|nr:autotransporter-associated beta strand repeat-containing protein [Kiritimatiellia bacterium]